MTSIDLLVTDLDNTLYDWVSFFVPSFYAMIDKAETLLGIERNVLLDELRDVHVLHKTSEQPFALLQTPTVRRLFSSFTREEMLDLVDPAFHAFNRKRRELLNVYPGVLATLHEIRRRGCRIVAHTEAPAANAKHRLEMLGIDHLIDALYAPADKGDVIAHPYKATKNTLRVVTLDDNSRKPAAHILEQVIVKCNTTPDRTLYVGDSLTRDIAMAKAVGAHSALALYGKSFSAEAWQGLVRISHWTAEDVSTEASLKLSASAEPDVVLDNFSQLLDRFCFEPALTTSKSFGA